MSGYSFMTPSVQRYIEVEQHAIPGWLYLVSCFMLPILDQAQKEKGITGDICEIGIFEGKTLALLGLLTEPEEICVGLDIEIRPGLHSNIQPIFPDRFPFLIEQRDSLKLDKAEVLGFSTAGGYRFFHVDGYHTFEHALNDLLLAVNTLKPGGIIFLDDFYSPTVPGVTEAFHHLIEQNLNQGIVPFAMGGAKAYLCHESYVDFYRDRLFQEMPMPSKSHPVVGFSFGRPIAIYDLYPQTAPEPSATKTAQPRIKRLEKRLQLKKQELQQTRRELKQLQDQVAAMQTSKFWRLREVYITLKKRIGLSG